MKPPYSLSFSCIYKANFLVPVLLIEAIKNYCKHASHTPLQAIPITVCMCIFTAMIIHAYRLKLEALFFQLTKVKLSRSASEKKKLK